ncbi:MAG: HDIG domain-containing protein [Spirochaetes bacterium]|nr:HDIG domain-containing protein [Spirochaetota bacterium]
MANFFISFFQMLLRCINSGKKSVSFIMLLALISLSTYFLSWKMVGDAYNYNLHDIATQNIRIPWDIVYEIKTESDKEKKIAELSVPLVFDMERNILNEKISNINFLFNHITNVINENGTDGNRQVMINQLNNRLPEYLNYNSRILNSLLSYSNPDAIRKTINSILTEIYSKGILETRYDNPLNIDNTNSVFRINYSNSDKTDELIAELEEINSMEDLKNSLNGICARSTTSYPDDQKWSVYIIVKSMIKPNLVFNPEVTKKRIQEISKTVKPVRGLLKKGNIVVREGDAVTEEALEKIQVLNKYSSQVHLNYILGIFLFQIIFFGVIIFFIRDYFHVLIPDINAPVIAGILLALFFIFTYLIFKSFSFEGSNIIFSLCLPIPFVVMTIAIIYNQRLAILISVYIIFYTNTLNSGDYASLAISINIVFISIFATRSLEKRTDFLKMGFIFGFINSLLVYGIGLMDEYTYNDIIRNIQLAFVSGLTNTIAVMAFFPVLEFLFGLTTKFKLLELTDLNASIFREMLISAPGTYNHSLMVANMAEAACKDIGADSLLARVGGYYHDIGKIEDSHIYIENKASHKINLSPYDYSKRIISHVEKGVELAKKNGLPSAVIDFIKEHHGDSTMTYFYHQALEEAHTRNKKEFVRQEDFRYPGPKAHSKESAVVMLADTVEAASRSIKNPTYEKLEEMIKKLIYGKLNNSELDYSNLTMMELNKIQKAFLNILNGIFHSRIEYPEQEEIEDLENKMNEKSK